MNKKTLKIAGWALGLSMAVAGIGTMAKASLFDPTESAIVKATTETITYTATGSGGSATLINGSTSWSVTSPSQNEASRGLQYSTKAATLRFTPDFDVTGLTLVGSSNAAGQVISYTVGGGSSKTVGTMTKTNNTEYVFSNFSCSSGQEIVISITAGTKSTYVKSITLSYEIGTPATIGGSSTGKAGSEWAPTGITEDVGGASVAGATYSFSAKDAQSNSIDITSWTKNASTGSIIPEVPCTLTVSAAKDGYIIPNKNVEISYADVVSVSLSSSSTTIAKGDLFDADDVTVTVNPSAYAEQVWTWSIKSAVKEDDETPMVLDTDYSWDSDSHEILADAAGTIVLTATSGGKTADFTLNVTSDPILNLDKTIVTVYSIDSSFSLAATPTNFPDGAVTYVWSSDDDDVVSTPDVATASAAINVVGAGSTVVRVSGWVGGVKQAEAMCSVTVLKTRDVKVDIDDSAVFDFEDITATGTRINTDTASSINDYLTDSSNLSEPTITLPDYDKDTTNYVYFGNGSGGAYANQGGFLKFGKSGKGGSIKFVFEETITSVTVSAQKWLSSGDEGEITINGETPDSNAGKSSFANVTLDGISTKEVTISTSDSSARAFVNSITFRSVQDDVQLGRTDDVIGLEKFIDRYMHMDAVVDGEGMTGTNACLGWYAGAKDAYNGVDGEDQLNDHQRELFATNSAYAAEKARLDAWAVANGDTGINATTHVLEANPTTANKFSSSSSNENLPLILAVSSVGFVTLGGAFLISRRRKEDR